MSVPVASYRQPRAAHSPGGSTEQYRCRTAQGSGCQLFADSFSIAWASWVLKAALQRDRAVVTGCNTAQALASSMQLAKPCSS